MEEEYVKLKLSLEIHCTGNSLFAVNPSYTRDLPCSHKGLFGTPNFILGVLTTAN